jgi:hypothetical protein
MNARHLIAVTAVAMFLSAAVNETKADVIWTLTPLAGINGGTLIGSFVTNDIGDVLSWEMLLSPGGSVPITEIYDSGVVSSIDQIAGAFLIYPDSDDGGDLTIFYQPDVLKARPATNESNLVPVSSRAHRLWSATRAFDS